jgi:DNA-binding CsgD family transcriptional regulator
VEVVLAAGYGGTAMSSTPVRSPLLVGRVAESGLLAAALARTAAGGVSAVLVGGEAGVGKSRVVEAFLARHPDLRVLAGGCVELGADGLPYAPFVAALRGADVDGAGLTAVQRRRLAPLLPGLDAPDAAPDDRPRMFEGVLTLLARFAEAGPTVLVLEDAHWADRSSLDLLEFLVRNQRAAPGSMVVVTHRSDEPGARGLRPLLAGLGRLGHVERMALVPFTRAEVGAQASALLGRPADPALVVALHGRSDGNPLFVEALLHEGNEPAGVPRSLADLLATRVDRLGDAAAVVRAAAVGGIRTAHAVLAAVCGEPVDAAVRAAVDAGVLVVEGDGYRFRHGLIRDAVLAGVLPGERAGLHRRFADVLAARGGSGAELSHHLTGAGDGPAAVAAAWAAAAQARRALAHAEELQLVERVLGWWDALPDSAALVGADRATVLETAAEAALRAGESERGEELASAALAEPGLDGVRLAALHELRARVRARTGHEGRAADLHAALAAVPQGHAIRPYLLNALAAYLMDLPDAAAARAAAHGALAATHGTGDDPAEASALVTLATLDARLGNLDGQLPRLARAAAVARTLGADHLRLRVLEQESHLLHGYGRLAEAERVARDGLAAAVEAGLARSAGPAHAVNLVAALLAAGRWTEAGETLERALDLVPPPADHARLLGLGTDLALGRGQLDHAMALLDRATDLVGRSPVRQPLLLPRLRGRVHLAQGDPRAAAEALAPVIGSADLAETARYAWPLLAVAAQTASAGRDPALAAAVAAAAAELPQATPPQRAWAATVSAHASGAVDAWAAAAGLWADIVHPFEHATALYHQGAALLATGVRDPAATALSRAAGLAEDLGAAPLLAAVTDLARRARLSRTGAAATDDTASRIGLTPRETEVLALLATGMGNAAIAERLYISPKTASVHVSNILGKLQVANRVEAAAAAHRLGLLADQEPPI